ADNAREYEKLGIIIHNKYGTHAQFTNAYTPQQNGVAECRMHTLLKRTRALLLGGNLPKELRGECVVHVANLLNMTSPYELWFGKKPSAQYLRVFGCTGYVHVPEPHRHKLEARAKRCMYVGIPNHKKGYRLIDVPTGLVVYSRDFTFNEKDTNSSTTTAKASAFTIEIIAQEYPLHANTPSKRNRDDNDCGYTQRADLEADPDTTDFELLDIHSVITLVQGNEPKSYREAMPSTHTNEWKKAA
ncbi:hypothetical protein PybrP1_010821, partial [[Pythium] brassicae (nom. inval.)]